MHFDERVGEKKIMNKMDKNKLNRILMYAGFGFAFVQLVISVIFMITVGTIDLLPGFYTFIIGIILVLLVLLVLFTQRWRAGGIVTKILSLLLIIIMLVGNNYLDITKKVLGKMSGENTKTATVGVYVLKDSPVQSLSELNGKSCGRLAVMDKENTDKMVTHLKERDVTLTYSDYAGLVQIIDALLDGKVEAILLNTSFIDVIADVESYEDITDRIRLLELKENIIVIEDDKDSDIKSEYQNENVITLYFSGIDTTGSPSTISRSDVNILCSINKKTHQIFLLSTPRDYYVPLSVSGGVRDKLTHAGIYGIDCSVDTLSMLYGIDIDYYVKVNFTGFVDIIDALGGVTVHSDYDFITRHGGYHIRVGENRLNGSEALGFARERYSLAGGDRQRGRNQMEVIRAMVSKLASPSILSNYAGIMASVSDSVVTNMPYDEISDLVKLQINEMPQWDIQQYSVDGTGTMSTTYSMNQMLYVMQPDYNTVNQAKEFFRMIYNDEIIETN